ncbi:MAG: molybdate ABC transporter substrate-binding protein [Rickettsiales bacterium]|jgi:molybdenum ABC transporter molybdate-binding protein|nr:molybdate ABC transporter substrate-binding protein [Rickettsiales bacterium]
MLLHYINRISRYVFLGLYLFAAFSARQAAAMPTVTVLAESSLSLAISELARSYSKQADVMVGASFASQQEQQQQIEEGGEADILITTRAHWIEDLKTQGLIDVYSEALIARNRLALVSKHGGAISPRNDGVFPLNEMLKLFSWEPSFVVGNPDVLDEGRFSKEALRNLGVAGDLEEYTLYIKSRAQMESMISQQGMIGLMFNSSVSDNRNLQMIDLLPESSHTPINYHAAVIAGDNMQEARLFMKFLNSDTAKVILRSHGFFVD